MAATKLEERRASRPEPIDNGSLPAGSPMYYYCRSCGHHVATLAEDWFEIPPPKLCTFCVLLREEGKLDSEEHWVNAR